MRRGSSILLISFLLSLGACAPRGGSAPGITRTKAPPDTIVVPVTAQDLHARVSRGHASATIVNVWATWCIPCRQEFPALLRVARVHAAKGVKLVLVSADFPDQLAGVHTFLAAQGVTDTTYLKAGEDMAFIEAMDHRWTGALPATFIYDRNGRLQSFWEGAGDAARFESALTTVLAAHSTGEERRP
jgi:thiol-disulfide isomerase/thioredoxin